MKKEELGNMEKNILDERFKSPLFFVTEENILTKLLTPLAEGISKMKIMRFLIEIFTKIPNPEKPSKFLSFSIANALIWSIIITLLSIWLLFFYSVVNFGSVNYVGLLLNPSSLLLLVILFIFLFSLTFANFIVYPTSILKNEEESARENALMGVYNFIIFVESGTPVIETIKILRDMKYGAISRIFKNLIKKIEEEKKNGINAIKETIDETESKLIKRILKQIIAAKERKITFREAMKGTIFQIKKEGKNSICSFQKYFLISLLIFSLISIILIMLIQKFNYQISNYLIMFAFISLYVLIQFILIGFIKSKRPKIRGLI